MLSLAVKLLAQNDTTLPPPETTSMWDIVTSGGWPGMVILLVLVSLSIAAVYLVIDQFISLRRADIIPDGLTNEVATALRESRWSDAETALRNRPSVLAGVISLALSNREFGWSEMEKAVEDSLVDRSAQMHRRIDYLSMIANLSPMVGLLGTVTGMIFAFRQVAATRGAAGAGDLAEGIYQALVTTVGGLIVAIPALAASGILRARVDELLSEVTRHTERALSPLRRRTAPGASASGSPSRVVPVAPAQMKGTKISSIDNTAGPPPAVPSDPSTTHPPRTRSRKST
ncbi:MotA/TolQ/ExbB proton channel family protein [Aporhodopirellula aestuarii]|uniref:MotA/TolQ/ExbB proton channel family protein n=1 Tax=Aporhodopirellula aestuarii TaxID=2950107 RepID=A0ABT0UC01_9BACT|nr:MotA/TolQ/ExbB proton channel family protein [Aporhodopirellula aestuarii]MCM2374020.1 MotA/TolQ/ExbB proton channel family protein [Aporhodopirellula aestuarii]